MITSKELSELIKDYQTIVKIQQNEIKRLKEQVKRLKELSEQDNKQIASLSHTKQF